MMSKGECYFEKVSKYADVDFPMPKRATANDAGYDMVAVEDVIIYPYDHEKNILFNSYPYSNDTYTIEEIAQMTKECGARPTLVPLGVKCKLPEGTYLKLVVRSSCPLKSWLIMANSEGIIDQMYYNNKDNEGLIYAQLINLSPFPIKVQKGDRLVQGIITPFYTTDDDNATGERVGGFGSSN